MANSYVEYTGDGVTTNFNVTFEYLDKSHVSVKVDGVDVAFTWNTSNTVALDAAPANGALIRIQRSSSPTVRLVDYQTPSILSEEVLDLDSKQGFFLGQEAVDTSQEAFDTAGVAATDAANALSTALAADGKADLAISTADAAASDASFALLTANSASTTASAANAKADNATLTANAAEATADAAAADAATAISTADGAVTTANAASSKADQAIATADAATTKADTAITTANGAVTTANQADVKATSAVTTASNAEAAASSALTIANDADAKADDALATAARAEELASGIDQRYLGAFAADPLTDNDGAPLEEGAAYYNTIQGRLLVFNGTEWVYGFTPSAEQLLEADIGVKVHPFQTPAELLAEIKSVDGFGSGLDADRLDGKEASEFASSEALQAIEDEFLLGLGVV